MRFRGRVISGEQQGPAQFDPEVRVVVPAQLAENLARALMQAAHSPAAVEQQAASPIEPSAKAR